MGDFSAYGRGGQIPSEVRSQDRQEKEHEIREEAEHRRIEKELGSATGRPWWRRLTRRFR